jgi:cysteine synthase B
MGTTGTIMGVSKFLKEQNPQVKVIGAQPADEAKIPGIRKWAKEYLPKIFDAARVDELIDVSENEARETAKRLALEEGIFGGMSSGGAVAIALKTIENLESGVVVAIICDRGSNYLSTDLFDDPNVVYSSENSHNRIVESVKD